MKSILQTLPHSWHSNRDPHHINPQLPAVWLSRPNIWLHPTQDISDIIVDCLDHFRCYRYFTFSGVYSLFFKWFADVFSLVFYCTYSMFVWISLSQTLHKESNYFNNLLVLWVQMCFLFLNVSEYPWQMFRFACAQCLSETLAGWGEARQQSRRGLTPHVVSPSHSEALTGLKVV